MAASLTIIIIIIIIIPGWGANIANIKKAMIFCSQPQNKSAALIYTGRNGIGIYSRQYKTGILIEGGSMAHIHQSLRHVFF